jgi:hypothetical protein
MQKQQTPNPDPKRDPNDIERAPGRDDIERVPDRDDAPNERHRDPLKQPGDVPDVKPDVIAGQRRSQGAGSDPGHGKPRPESPQRRKQ